MKAKELRKFNKEELLKIKKDLEFQLIKSKSLFGKGMAKTQVREKERSGFAPKGIKTSLTRDIRRNIARINTILKEREVEMK